jgi:ribosomal-protein-alanine N-acetyltransferase
LIRDVGSAPSSNVHIAGNNAGSQPAAVGGSSFWINRWKVVLRLLDTPKTLRQDDLMQDSVAERPISMRTVRLELIAMNLTSIEAELAGPEVLGALLGVVLPASWPPGEFDRDALLYFRGRLQSSPVEQAGWYGWYAISTTPRGQREALVGAVGYFGPPVAGSVEIGYSVIAEARNRGFATECVRALLDRAFRFPEVRRVIAHTRDDTNVASTKVLLGCGFRHVGPSLEAGLVRYQRDRSPADQA